MGACSTGPGEQGRRAGCYRERRGSAGGRHHRLRQCDSPSLRQPCCRTSSVTDTCSALGQRSAALPVGSPALQWTHSRPRDERQGRGRSTVRVLVALKQQTRQTRARSCSFFTEADGKANKRFKLERTQPNGNKMWAIHTMKQNLAPKRKEVAGSWYNIDKPQKCYTE